MNNHHHQHPMLHLISLGSSFAAGPGIPPIVDTQANRSGRNYPSLLVGLIGADKHTDLTVSGATLLNILSDPQGDIPPQLASLPKCGPDDNVVVTITAGGNDIGYVGRIMLDCCNASWLEWPVGMLMSRRMAHGWGDLSEDGLVDRFTAVIRAIRAKIPQAEIILVGYLTLLGDHAEAWWDAPLSDRQMERSRTKADLLARAYARAASQEQCRFVDIATDSRDHGVGSPEPWVSGHVSVWSMLRRGEVGWHPNLKGMEAVARLVSLHRSSKEVS